MLEFLDGGMIYELNKIHQDLGQTALLKKPEEDKNKIKLKSLNHKKNNKFKKKKYKKKFKRIK